MSTMKMNRLATSVAALLSLSAPAAQAREWSFAVVPQVTPAKLTSAWTPLLAEVERRSGVRLRLETAPSIREFDARFLAEDFDFALINPLIYTRPGMSSAYRAIAREGVVLKGLIVVRRDSPFSSLSALKGARVAFPGPDSYAAGQLNKRELAKIGLVAERDMISVYVDNQDEVYRAVLDGRVEAGGGIRKTFDLLSADERERLRILHETPEAMSLPIAANRRVPDAQARLVARALTELSNSPEGAALLKAVGMKTIVPARDSDWDGLRERPASKGKL